MCFCTAYVGQRSERVAVSGGLPTFELFELTGEASHVDLPPCEEVGDGNCTDHFVVNVLDRGDMPRAKWTSAVSVHSEVLRPCRKTLKAPSFRLPPAEIFRSHCFILRN